MKDNPLAQAVREKKVQQPVDFGRLMRLVEEIHAAVVNEPEDKMGPEPQGQVPS